MPRSLVLFTVTTVVLAVAGTAAWAADTDGVWVNGKAEHLLTGPPPVSPKHPAALYVIAPVSAAHPLHPQADAATHGFGAHDHVLAAPKGARSFKGTCDLRLVVPGPKGRPGTNIAVRSTLTPAGEKPLLYSARLDQRLRPLSSAARIQQAVHAGLATVVDTKTVIGCSVSP